MKVLKLYHFENQFGQTNYKANNIYTTENNDDYLTLPNQIITFFDNHSNKVNDYKKTQNVRFKMPHAQFLIHLSNMFGSVESFGNHCDYLAEKFKYSLKQAPKKSFYLIFYRTEVQGMECLSILTMEAKTGWIYVNILDTFFESLFSKRIHSRECVIVSA